MKVAVFGACGKTGRELVDELLRNHHVVAFCKHPAGLPTDEKLATIAGDALNPFVVDKAINGTDAVMCTLGVKPGEKKDMLSAATANILSSMIRFKVKRFVCETGYGTSESRAYLPFLYKTLLTILLGKILRDKERQEQLIEASNLDWIIVRPTILTNGKSKEKIQIAEKLKWNGFSGISRKDVAKFMADQLADDTWLRKKVAIT